MSCARWSADDGGLLRLVLVLLGVELEIEQAGEIAARAAAATAAATAGAERHLDLAERRLGAQQMLQRLLLVGDGVLPLLLLELAPRPASSPRPPRSSPAETR